MSTSSKNKQIAFLGLLVLTILWGYNWVVMKSVLRYMGAFDFAALRCLLGAGCLFIVLMVRGIPLKPPPLLPTALIGLLQTGGMIGISQWALISGGAGKVAVLVYTMPFWIILMAVFFLGESMRKLQYLAVSIALVGIIFVLQPWNFAGAWWASTLALISSISWAASAIVAKKLYARYPDVNLLSLTTWQMAIGAVVIAVIALFVEQPTPVWNEYVFFALAYNAIPATAFAWVLWLFLLKNLPTSIAGLSMLAVPVFGIFFAWLSLNEVPSSLDDAGVALILLALAVVNIPKRD
ncbi:EamA family transporter [Microvirga sp. W0021]|uniref:EamA family transporter n=1 Tax=Hohaiivirga grylli TaxID=3133970 RepID=A0ABV0BHU0_9HYPH